MLESAQWQRTYTKDEAYARTILLGVDIPNVLNVMTVNTLVSFRTAILHEHVIHVCWQLLETSTRIEVLNTSTSRTYVKKIATWLHSRQTTSLLRCTSCMATKNQHEDYDSFTPLISSPAHNKQ